MPSLNINKNLFFRQCLFSAASTEAAELARDQEKRWGRAGDSSVSDRPPVDPLAVVSEERADPKRCAAR